MSCALIEKFIAVTFLAIGMCCEDDGRKFSVMCEDRPNQSDSSTDLTSHFHTRRTTDKYL